MLCARGYYHIQFVWISGLARGNIPNPYFAKKTQTSLTIRLINEVSRPMASLEIENVDSCGHIQRKNKLYFRRKRSQYSFLDFEAKD